MRKSDVLGVLPTEQPVEAGVLVEVVQQAVAVHTHRATRLPASCDGVYYLIYYLLFIFLIQNASMVAMYV